MEHFQVGIDYPAPIIKYTLTTRQARIRLHPPRQSEVGGAEQARILEKHSLPASDRQKETRRKLGKKRKGVATRAEPVGPSIT